MAQSKFRPIPMEDILSPRPYQTRNAFQWRGRPGELKPLWAILDEPPPIGWEPPNTQDARLVEFAAAESTPNQPVSEPHSSSDGGSRRPPGLWVVERPSLGVGPAHTAIEYVPKEGEPQWISAGSEHGQLVSGVGGKDYPEVRSRDRSDNMSTVGRITPPKGMTNADQWEILKSLDSYYKDNVDYDTWPELQDSYNSNSYTRGLLDAGGATYTVPFDEYVGGASPLPAQHFIPPHVRATGVKKGFEPNQPPPHFRRLPRTR